jgi:hypothetical protein
MFSISFVRGALHCADRLGGWGGRAISSCTQKTVLNSVMIDSSQASVASPVTMATWQMTADASFRSFYIWCKELSFPCSCSGPNPEQNPKPDISRPHTVWLFLPSFRLLLFLRCSLLLLPFSFLCFSPSFLCISSFICYFIFFVSLLFVSFVSLSLFVFFPLMCSFPISLLIYLFLGF